MTSAIEIAFGTSRVIDPRLLTQEQRLQHELELETSLTGRITGNVARQDRRSRQRMLRHSACRPCALSRRSPETGRYSGRGDQQRPFGPRTSKGRTVPFSTKANAPTLVSALRCVDHVVVFDEPDVRHVLDVLRPAIHAKGTDYTEDTVPERE